MSTEFPNSGDRFRSDLLSWAECNLREFPWRERSRSLYEVFVAEFFLTQTPADNVAEVYPQFLEEYPTLRSIRESNVEELEAVIRPLGFHKMRAEALRQIAANHEELPDHPEELTELTRVGPYVANTTLCVARDRGLPIIDRNVNRVYERVFGDDFPDDEDAQMEFALNLLPDDGAVARTYNLALVDFGSLVCEKRDPNCEICFATEYCDYYETEVNQ